MRLLRAALLVSFVAGLCCQMTGAQDRKEWQFVNENFAAVLSDVIPLNKDTLVSVRIHKESSTDVLEYSLSLVRESDGQTVAVVRAADGVSVYDQLMRLHHANPAASVASLKSQLKIREWRVSDRACPAIKTQLTEYEKLRLPLMAAGVNFVQRPTVYEFSMGGSPGSVQNVTATMLEKTHPLMGWANETRRILDTCKTTHKSP
jgi:hypothetical protein